ncbi:MAG: DUF4912 domain-containing protein, partial [Planctomycetota bacterium]|nr:DUF4912 domain-containing protein [Planctomycetota bacterium]
SGFVDRGAPIPEQYGVDRLVVLPRDPDWVFVYWELSGRLWERLRRQHPPEALDESRWVLRVHTLHEAPCFSAANGDPAREPAVAASQTMGGPYLVNVDVSAGQWYLRTASDTRLVVELGFVHQDGAFVGVLRGNEASTPRPRSSNVVDERWAIQRAELEVLLRASGAAEFCARATGGPGSESAPRFLRSEQPRALGLFSSYLAEMERQSSGRAPVEP